MIGGGLDDFNLLVTYFLFARSLTTIWCHEAELSLSHLLSDWAEVRRSLGGLKNEQGLQYHTVL